MLHSRRLWRGAKLPLSSPGPVTTQLSAPALIIILLPTNTAQLPLETPTTRLPQAAKNPGREKLVESNNGSDQTAINQPRKHLNMKNVDRSPTPLALMQRAGERSSKWEDPHVSMRREYIFIARCHRCAQVNTIALPQESFGSLQNFTEAWRNFPDKAPI